MSEMTETNSTKCFFRKHPISGAIVAMALTWLVRRCVFFIPAAAAMIRGDAPRQMTRQEYLPWVILEAVIVLLLYCKVSKKQPKDYFSPVGMGRGILMGCSILILVAVETIMNLSDGMVFGDAASSLTLALYAGIGEELMFRLMPLGVVMDADAGRKTTVMGCVVTAAIFGLAHCVHLHEGADPTATLLQVIYAAGIGLLFAGIYVKTKNVWVTMILHTFVDFMSFLVVPDPTKPVTGLLTQALPIREIAFVVISIVVYFINASMLLRTISDTKAAEIR